MVIARNLLISRTGKQIGISLLVRVMMFVTVYHCRSE